MTSPEATFLSALRAHLLTDAGVRAALGDPARIYDEPPPDPVWPYVTFGRIETTVEDSSDSPAQAHVLMLHVWSRAGGRLEALAVVHALRAASHHAEISIAGRRLVLCLAGFSDVFRAEDGRTVHGVLRLRAITEPT